MLQRRTLLFKIGFVGHTISVRRCLVRLEMHFVTAAKSLVVAIPPSLFSEKLDPALKVKLPRQVNASSFGRWSRSILRRSRKRSSQPRRPPRSSAAAATSPRALVSPSRRPTDAFRAWRQQTRRALFVRRVHMGRDRPSNSRLPNAIRGSAVSLSTVNFAL